MPDVKWPSDSKFVDVTKTYQHESGPWGQKPFYWGRCDLRRAVSGRICFRIGLAMQCGGSYEFSQSESHTVTLSAGGELGGIEASAEVSHEWTVGVSISREIGNCESANPEVCYPDSLLKIFDCVYESPITISWGTEVKFEPGSTGTVVWNIIQDPSCCPQTDPQLAERSPQASFVNRDGAGTVLLVPGHFGLRSPHEIPAAEKAHELARVIARQLDDHARGDSGCAPSRVGVAASDGAVAWLSRPGAAVPAAAAFLSGTRWPHSARGVLLLASDEALPVVVAASADVGSQATLRIESHGKRGKVAEWSLDAQGESHKVFAGFVPPKQHRLEPGEEGCIAVDLKTASQPLRICQPFRVGGARPS